jgi:hypothetical protein
MIYMNWLKSINRNHMKTKIAMFHLIYMNNDTFIHFQILFFLRGINNKNVISHNHIEYEITSILKE